MRARAWGGCIVLHGRYGGTEVVVMTAGEGDGLEPGPDGEPARKRRGTATV